MSDIIYDIILCVNIEISGALPTEARRLTLAPHNEIYVSAASIWEISIKHGLGRIDIPVSGGEAADYFTQAGYMTLTDT
jgi:PIN domain nuclease of toxin-antitoxin system